MIVYQLSLAQLGSARLSSTQLDSARFSSIQLDSAWLSLAWLGLIWLSTAQGSILASKFKRSTFCSNTFEFLIKKDLYRDLSWNFLILEQKFGWRTQRRRWWWDTLRFFCSRGHFCWLVYLRIYCSIYSSSSKIQV